MLRFLWRLLFVFPQRLQKWIERLLLVVGLLAFVWRLLSRQRKELAVRRGVRKER